MNNPPGYEPWDLGQGKDGADLSSIPDNSLREIRASHVLEHFPWRATKDVLREWFRALEPGGLVKIAVPDWEYITTRVGKEKQADGLKDPLQHYVYGSQLNERDFHFALFTRESLVGMLHDTGFVNVTDWLTEYPDCSSMSLSLNLMAYKPGPGIVDQRQSPELIERVNSFPYWYHRIELPGGTFTPGWAPILPAAYHIPDRLDGLTVLDIGAWDGYWSFEAVKRGAKHVLAIDDFSDTVGVGIKHPAWETFDFCRAELGISPSVCDRVEMSVYEIHKLEPVDIVFFFGVFYHLKHPLFAVEEISRICRRELYVESAILDDYSPYRGGIGNGYRGDQFLMEFYPGAQYGSNPGNWFVPTLRCLTEIVASHGFRDTRGWKLVEPPKSLNQCRGFVRGVK